MRRTETLENIFAAFVNQGTLEEAAEWMASATQAHAELYEEFGAALRAGVSAAERGSELVMAAVNGSGYRVSTAGEAGQYCQELLSLYERAVRGRR